MANAWDTWAAHALQTGGNKAADRAGVYGLDGTCWGATDDAARCGNLKSEISDAAQHHAIECIRNLIRFYWLTKVVVRISIKNGSHKDPLPMLSSHYDCRNLVTFIVMLRPTFLNFNRGCFQLPKDFFQNANSIMASGVGAGKLSINGKSYITLRSDPTMILAKSGTSGVTICKGNQTFIVGIYDGDSVQPSNNCLAASVTCDKLKESGY